MTTTESTYRVHCSHCQTTISSDSPALLDDLFPFCALCELTALMTDPAFAWTQDEAPALTADDEEWWG